MKKITLLIAGAGGRMGQAVARIALADPAVTIGGVFDRAGAPCIGRDLGTMVGQGACGIEIISDLTTIAGKFTGVPTVLIDFTMPAPSLNHARICADHGIAHVIATTGFSADEESLIADKAQTIPIVKAGNMSTGMTLLSVLVAKAAAALGEEFDIEITEAHHRHKVDAPSGSALLLGAAAAAGRGVSLGEKSTDEVCTSGIRGPRKTGDIGFSVIRGGGIIGDHSVMFASEGETITLSHHAIDRKLFAEGAVRAAKWLCQNGAGLRAPGLYSMHDVLGSG